MAVLQNCIDCEEDGTGSCSETCVKCDVDGTEKIFIKQEAIDIEDEIPEVITSSVNPEHEVRLQGVCVCVCVC
jgi:hypothetical protein